MKIISEYILEKFKISKDIKNIINTDTIVSCITDICRIPIAFSESKDLVDEIEKWAKENGLEEFDEIEAFAPLSAIKGSDTYNRLKEDGWLKKIQDVPAFTTKSTLKEINALVKDATLVAEYKKNSKYGKLYKYENDYRYGNAIVYIREYNETYFWFKVKEKK